MSSKITKGKIPPQAIEIETAILGAMLQSEKGSDSAMEIIKTPHAFYKNQHQLIFEAIQNLDSKNSNIDILTVSEELKRMGKLEEIGGDFTLISLTQKVASSAHIESHCYIVLQFYMKRMLIKMGNEVIEMGYDDKVDVFDALDSTTMFFDKINNIHQKGAMSMDWASAMDEVPKRVERLTNNKGELTGVDTGLKNLNVFFNGWQPSDLIVIGADSGMGKTALAMAHILAPAKNGHPVGMISMEMSVLQLAIRAVAVESNFHMKQLTQTGFEKTQYFKTLTDYVHELRGLPVHIDDRPSLTIPEMKRRARYMKRKHDIKLLIVDFIQMFVGEEDDTKLTGLAARELKNLAKELEIPVLALSQLNREVKKVKWCIPAKYHLKNSSGVEEAADVIGLLYRPEYYGYKRADHPSLWDQFDLKGDENATFIVAKNRNGGVGNIPMRYLPEKTKYIDPDPDGVSDDDDNPFV